MPATSGRAQAAIGQSLEALGQNEAAEKGFRKALEAADGVVESRTAYGVFLFRQGRH